MLFFKQIKDEKLSEKEFESFYSAECHICSLTTKIISLMEAGSDRTAILGRLTISVKDYENLKSGDRCDPEQVLRLARHLGIQNEVLAGTCPRLTDPSPG